MNKYSQKIVNFLDENLKDNFKNKININHLLIQQIINIAKEINEEKIDYNNLYMINIDKIHNDKYPILYQMFITQYPNFRDFLTWYIINQQNIYIDRNHNVYKLLFSNQERKHLHNILYNNQFISIDVCYYFEINNIVKYTIDNDIFELNLYLTENDITDKFIYLEKIIKIIKFMYNLNLKLINKKPEKIKVTVLLSHQRKEFSELDILTPININSGSAMREILVTVWREEELEKVLIHEIQHYLACDFYIGTQDYDYVKNILNNYFKVSGNDMVNESYNETMAHIISMCYQSVKLNMSLDKMYDYEMKFLLLQTAKIINFFGGNNIFTTNYKQTTSVLSYYVIKTILFYNINNTIDLINNFELKCIDNNIKTYGDYLDKILEVTKKDNINNYIISLINIINNLKECFIKRTLRMTAIN